jgi:hypothetical protein
MIRSASMMFCSRIGGGDAQVSAEGEQEGFHQR